MRLSFPCRRSCGGRGSSSRDSATRSTERWQWSRGLRCPEQHTAARPGSSSWRKLPSRAAGPVCPRTPHTIRAGAHANRARAMPRAWDGLRTIYGSSEETLSPVVLAAIRRRRIARGQSQPSGDPGRATQGTGAEALSPRRMYASGPRGRHAAHATRAEMLTVSRCACG
jgi:hypothetical protein